MCLTVPGEIVALDGDMAVVRVDGRLRQAATLAVPDLRVGDRVIVAAGSVMARLDQSEADEIERLVRVAYGDDAGGPPP
ncbi:MAG TPA: HypC/HybG/HupF family hydrogenase formation chaperone [Candidatus Limnocylindrales bacterium]|nr:HypC/HybG/HupF family hydrogenase formation chaperone [Candidatus Limnocylindrales bacterium]